MPKYVDAEALNAPSQQAGGCADPRCAGHHRRGPVADVVQVVRCRDCVCMGKRPPLPEGYREDCGWCMLHGRVVLPEDFCSNGERMDDDA